MARTNRTEWAKRVERWKDSGLTAKDFAAEIGVKASALTYWSWKIRADAAAQGEPSEAESRRSAHDRKSAKPAEQPRPKFVEFSAESVATKSSTLELVLRGGVLVRVPKGFDEATLMRVVRVVEASQ